MEGAARNLNLRPGKTAWNRKALLGMLRRIRTVATVKADQALRSVTSPGQCSHYTGHRQGSWFTRKNGDISAITETVRSCAAPISKVELYGSDKFYHRHSIIITYLCMWYITIIIINNSFYCNYYYNMPASLFVFALYMVSCLCPPQQSIQNSTKFLISLFDFVLFFLAWTPEDCQRWLIRIWFWTLGHDVIEKLQENRSGRKLKNSLWVELVTGHFAPKSFRPCYLAPVSSHLPRFKNNIPRSLSHKPK